MNPVMIRPWGGGRETRRTGVRQVRAFVLGSDELPAAWVPTWRLLPAVVTYLRVGRVFERHGLTAAERLIGPVRPGAPQRRTDDRGTAYCARAASWRILGVARTLAGRHLCLHESLGLCAALRQLGFPAQIVLGYPVIELATGEEELHAWPALGPWPLTGRADGEPVSYTELRRFPPRPAGENGGPRC